MSKASDTLAKRLVSKPLGHLNIVTGLQHFALITYALPAERLRPHIHMPPVGV